MCLQREYLLTRLARSGCSDIAILYDTLVSKMAQIALPTIWWVPRPVSMILGVQNGSHACRKLQSDIGHALR